MTYSVIIPALDEAQGIAHTIRSIRAACAEAEIIVADGGSSDGTGAVALANGAAVVSSPRGRGTQCNAGAKRADGDILMFLHADTVLPRDAFDVVAARFQNASARIATFRLAFDQRHWLLSAYGFLTRFDSVITRFGDQCIVVRRSFFDSLGGFPDWPFFEDVDFLRKARRRAKIHSLPATVVTSARRFREVGMVRNQVVNARLMLRYLTGGCPAPTAVKHEEVRAARSGCGRITTRKTA